MIPPPFDARVAGPLSERDLAAWAEYARHVAPLPGRTLPQRRAIEADAAPISAPRITAVPPRARAALVPLRIGDQPAGLDHATWSRFRSGRLRPARVLDLHGHTVHRAYHALSAALHSAQAERLRCIEVVTGRGSGEGLGAIRRELPLWLNLPELRPLVLAAAHPNANPGATRLLLRRRRE